MHSHVPTRRWLIAAFAAAALACAGTPDNALAGCGDHILILNPDGSAQPDHHAPAAPKPCDGPACRQTPAKPAAPNAPTTPSHRPGDALLAAVDPAELTGPSWPHVESDYPPRLNPTSIFHPPRA